MKKIYIISAIAVAAIAVSCNKIENPAQPQGVTVSFTGEMAEDVKTYLDPETFQVKFNKNDPFMTAAIQGTAYKSATIYVSSNDGVEPVAFNSATYDLPAANETIIWAGTYHLSGYPSPANLASKGTADYKSWPYQKITAKGPVGTSTNGCAGKPLIALVASATYSSMPTDVKFQFHHVYAYGNIKIANLGLPAEDKVKEVKISSATRYFYNKMIVKKDGTVTVGTSNYGKELFLDVTDMNITSGNFNVVFVTAPVDVSETTTTITITTNDGKVFSKAVKAPKGKGKFQIGHILPFNVDFTGVEAK